jgi:hypothetical protein
MLRIKIAVGDESFDEKTNEFIPAKEQELQLEHSLVSMSKWESEHLKPFLGKAAQTDDEVRDYVRCMTLTQNVDPEVYKHISKSEMDQITAYMNSPMSATIVNEVAAGKGSREVITSELIYYWMVAQNIPFECQKWHLNRLFSLIKVCSIKNTPPKKMNQKEILSRNKSLNEARKKALNTKG